MDYKIGIGSVVYSKITGNTCKLLRMRIEEIRGNKEVVYDFIVLNEGRDKRGELKSCHSDFFPNLILLDGATNLEKIIFGIKDLV